MKSKLLWILIAGLLTCITNSASATTLTTKISMDNGYEVFLSTSNSVQGTSFGKQNDWQHVYTDTVELIADVDYFLHVYGYDAGGRAGFIGDFFLTGNDHIFSNNNKSLTTNTTDWKGNNTGWGTTYTTLNNYGTHASSLWSWQPLEISNDAEWIWAGDYNSQNVAYFSTKISSKDFSPVPEPTTMLLFGVGLLGIAGVSRREKANR